MVYPYIEHINDVAPYVENNPNFVILDRGEYKVIDYVSQFGAFDLELQDLNILLECRGLIFDQNGKIISRPLRKFFNFRERPHHVNLNWAGAKVYDKLDGSMIRPIKLGNSYRLATRKGITDVALLAEKHLEEQNLTQRFEQFFDYCGEFNATPVFEFLSVDHRIVIQHEKDDLVLLAIRINHSGYYLSYDFLKRIADGFGLSVVSAYNMDEVPETLLERIKNLTGEEGVVVEFQCGERVKIKSEEYCLKHRTKSYFDSEKNIIECIKEGKLDDVKGLLTERQLERLNAFEEDFVEGVLDSVDILKGLLTEAKDYLTDKRTFAVDFVNKQDPKWRPILFSLWESLRNNTQILHFNLILNSIKCNTSKDVEDSRWLFKAKWS